MRDFKILIKEQGSDASKTLDMFDGVDVNVVFNVKDIREPENIKSNYTKQFEIPATKENNKFFAGALDSGMSPTTFNPNFKAYCQLVMDEETIIDGYLQLVDINKGPNSIDSYSIIIYGEVSSVFNDMKLLKVNDLDFSKYNHIWNYTNITNSWDTSIVRDDVDIDFYLGRGYVYPFEWRGQSTSDMGVEDFLPSMYVKTIWDAIFNYNGRTYTSEFLNSEKFRRLIIPYVKSHIYLSDEQTAEREFTATKTSDETLVTMPMTIAQTSAHKLMYFDSEVDPNGLFDGYTFTTNYKQNSSIGVTVKLSVTYTPSTPQPSGFLVTGPNTTATIYLWDGTNQKTVASETIEFVHSTGTVGVLGTNYTITNESFLDYTGILEDNTQYRVYVAFTVPSGPNSSKLVNTLGQSIKGNMVCKSLTNSEIYNAVQETWLYEGDTIDFNQIIPDIKINDFLTSINKMFNLYWLPDGDNNFIIEPRDDLYSKDDVQILDWTNKTDRDSLINITPLEELNNSEYLFTYSDDNDYYNDKYTTEYDEVYGQKLITVNNDFVKDTNIIKTLFSPSPLVQHQGSNRVCNTYVEFKDGVFDQKEVKYRISIYGGLKSCSSWNMLHDGGTSTSKTTYPFAGHIDDPNSPSYDINYGFTKTYYYNWSNVVTNNLYNNYWDNYIKDITAEDSHIWKGTLHLTIFDIVNLSLFDTIQMDEVFYKINKLDYNPLTELADVELFKTTSFNSTSNSLLVKTNVGSTSGSTGGVGPVFPGGWGTPVPWIDTPSRPWGGLQPWRGVVEWTDWTFHSNGFEGTYRGVTSTVGGFTNKTWGKYDVEKNINNNTYKLGNFVKISGKNNYVAPTSSNITLIGNNNQVSSESTNINIVGNNNFVEYGVSNVSAVGNNLYITKSNVSYINKSIIENGVVSQQFNKINGSIDEVQNPFESSVNPNWIRNGYNTVQNIGGMSPINYLKGGVDNSLFFSRS